VSPTFHIENFGCRAARADGEAIAALLRATGTSESQPSEADVVIVNTCSVTAEADREARAYIRRTHRLNPAARIIATGCYAQRVPEELAAIDGVSAVIGNSHKALAPEIALGMAKANVLLQSEPNGLIQIQAAQAEVTPPQVILADDTFAHSFLEEAHISPGAQTRPNLKIQEGCSNRCSFCVIPQTRGNSRSLRAELVLSRIQNFVAAGGNELVLSGINLGRWGRDLDPAGSELRTLASLVRTVLDQTDLPRLRLSSIEPMDWNSDLIELMQDFGGTRLARHAHLPLQSGSDAVLRRMHRRYRPWHYADKVSELLRAAGPALTLGADVMVGFPGETDREFQETFDSIRDLPFGYLHLFPFSPRPGTRAWTLHTESPVPAASVNERMAALRALGAEKTRAHRRQFVGAELSAITLHTPSALAANHQTSALTENFLPIALAAPFPANQMVHVRITELAADGTLVASPAVPITSVLHSQFSALPISGEHVLETAF
jgi:threonylcarbamoyladenosine tRNA methylthiotransferase MtaB